MDPHYFPKMIYRKDGSFKIVNSEQEESATLDEIKGLEAPEHKKGKKETSDNPPWPTGK